MPFAALQPKLSIGPVDDPFEAEADRVADQVMRMPEPTVRRKCAKCREEEESIRRSPTNGLQRKCAKCQEEEESVRRSADASIARRTGSAHASHVAEAPPIVHDALRGGGAPLDTTTRAVMEPRFGHDFGAIRVHTDRSAAESARSIDALAYTVGNHIVFGQGRYEPGSSEGRRLLAHELTHTVQQGAVTPDSLQRTPANKVSCSGSTPLNVPGTPALSVADPVGVITAAEDRANQVLDAAIDDLDFTRGQILGGAPIGWPTIGDSLARAMRLLSLDPDSDHVWRDTGIGTAHLLLRRLRAIRRTIGAGSFFFTCIGPRSGSIGVCSGDICTGANAVSCGGSFRIVFCAPFWRESAEAQAETLLHESSHNFAHFIQDRGREGNEGCYSRFAQVAAGVDEAHQRADLCPDP
jgi:hypothetical protein